MFRKFSVLILVLLVAGCANMRGSGPEPSAERFDPPPAEESVSHRYYDFDDIPIPNEMKISPRDSILFESQNIRAGMLTFTGRVDSDSLFNYFQVSMQNEGWRLLSYIKYGNYILTFDKPEKICIVRITERQFSSELQIWISPKISKNL
ncbi:hypothetical protein [Desulfonatronovibrio hydrogenovorans]|uniref:hypothetical protein n=1 Tax=Desulfonatronovibrio hydrogenovorans TaxID=53245 RepID=UPI00048B2B2F|nr:hypothetical protein [Desulfonatronovibrio hydrogenovorans]